ncbi:MAG: HAD hydrolase family protein [Bacteroidota bacterium]
MNVAFIPVRGGSKSIPLKNIKSFCGKPLVYWVLKAANETSEIDEVILATESETIRSIVVSFGFSKVKIYDRDIKNAQDSSSTESVIQEYLEYSDLTNEDNFILIQATSPLLTSRDLKRGLKELTDNDSVVSCVRSKRFFWDKNGNPINYDFYNRPRRQEFEGVFMENGAFYISQIKSIRKSGNRISGKIAISEMPEYTGIEIDEEEDWIVAEAIMKRILSTQIELNSQKIKLVISDVDGVLTDAGMYYSESGDELKKFNTHDGMAFQILRERGIKTGIVTSENTKIVENRAKKLKLDYLYQGKKYGGKLEAVEEICKLENITLNEVAYIGDDRNCFELLSRVGLSACPANAIEKIKAIPKIRLLTKNGGAGVFREFVELIVNDSDS